MKTLTNARPKRISAVNMHFAATLMAHTIAPALMDFKATDGFAKMCMNATKKPTIAVSMPSVQIPSGLIAAPAIVVFKEMDGPARI